MFCEHNKAQKKEIFYKSSTSNMNLFINLE
jgi:hypothetical protein